MAADWLSTAPQSSDDQKIGKIIAGALLILFTDLFVGLPCAAVIFLAGGGTPPALAAEAIEVLESV